MADTEHSLWQLLDDARALPRDDSRVRSLEDVIRRADTSQNDEIAFDARLILLECASSAGRWELTTIHFPWLLAKCRENPDRFDKVPVTLNYLSAVQSLPMFAGISKSDILAAQKDMVLSIIDIGYAETESAKIMFTNAVEMGDLERATELSKILNASDYITRTRGSAHDLYIRGWFRLLNNEMELGIKDAFRAFDTQYCSLTIRAFSSGMLLPVLYRRAETDRIEELTATCIRAIQGKPGMIEPYAQFMTYLALSGNVPALHTHFPEFSKFGERNQNQLDRLRYLQAARFCIRVMTDDKGEVAIRLPAEHPKLNALERYDGVELEQNFIDRARKLADAFDRRNENTFYSSRLNDSLTWVVI